MQVQTINIALPRLLVEEADLAARKEYRNRSELIREALRIYLAERNEWEQLFAYGGRKAKLLGIKKEKDIERMVAKYRHGKGK